MKKWKQSLSEEHFYMLYKLLENHPWILEKQEALEDLWSICDNNDKKLLIIDFLDRFKLLDNKDLTPLETEIFNHILDVWKLNPDKVVFLPIADKKEMDGSIWILDSMKQKLPDGFNPKKCLNNLVHCKDTKICSEDQNLVVVDDFIGSGQKLTRKLKYVLENSICKNIYCVCPTGMEEGINNLQKLYPSIKFFVPLHLKKAISDFYQEKVSDKKGILQKITEEFKLKGSTHYLGVGQAEALFSYEDRNIPNNVFPIFWGNNFNNYKTFFRRRK